MIRFATGVGITAAGRLNIYASKAGARTFFPFFRDHKETEKSGLAMQDYQAVVSYMFLI